MSNAKQHSAADALVAALISTATADGRAANAADALLAIARAIEKLAFHVKYLGGGDNADSRGAVEFLAIKVEEGASRIAEAGEAIAGAIAGLAETIEGASESIGSRISDVADDIVNGIEDAITRNRRPTDTE